MELCRVFVAPAKAIATDPPLPMLPERAPAPASPLMVPAFDAVTLTAPMPVQPDGGARGPAHTSAPVETTVSTVFLIVLNESPPATEMVAVALLPPMFFGTVTPTEAPTAIASIRALASDRTNTSCAAVTVPPSILA